MLADMRGKRDEAADKRDRLAKELDAQRAAMDELRSAHVAELERLGASLQKEAAEKEDALKASATKEREAEELRREVARLGEALGQAEAAKVKAEKEAASTLMLFHEVDKAFSGHFPETQQRAERAVVQRRADLGGEVEEAANWTMKEIVLACETCLTHMKAFLQRLRSAGEEVVEAFWPGRTAPIPTDRVARWLEHAVGRFNAWRASAA